MKRAFTLIVLSVIAAQSAAQTLIHRYSFNGNAQDSVGAAHGTVVGSVTLYTAYGTNGAAVFSGGTSASAPGYIRLPVSAVSGLQNATLEFFTTNFNIPNERYGQAGGFFQPLFAVCQAYGSQANYIILAANRSGTGIGVGARINGGNESVIAAHDPLPASFGNHVVDMVYSGFTSVGSAGSLTIYLDGVQVAQGATRHSFAAVAAGSGGVTTAGIGGGSSFNDPTFSGAMCEVRIFDGALTASQIAANVSAGPAVLGFTPPYTLSEAARALQIAAGIGSAATSAEIARLGLEQGGSSASRIDMLDALRLARKAVGLDTNP